MSSTPTHPKAVILMSGGLDSTTVLEIAKSRGFELYALSFRYGQRHSVELDAVKQVIAHSPVKTHHILDLDLRIFGGSALTADIEVPKSTQFEGLKKTIPITYVPARNTIFLSFALAYAETIGAFDIFMGANVIDYSNYPDCRPEYLEAFEKMANLATRAGVTGERKIRIHAPLLQMSKGDIIRKGLELGVDYSLTLSCYDPTSDGHACRQCDACHLRIKGFAEVGMADPGK